MGVEEGFQYIKDGFVNTNIVGASWVIPAIVIIISMLLVTRDRNQWKVLAFPMSFAWLLGGLRVSLVILLITGILFMVETMSVPLFGRILQTVSAVGGEGFKRLPFMQRRAETKKLEKETRFMDRKRRFHDLDMAHRKEIKKLNISEQVAKREVFHGKPNVGEKAKAEPGTLLPWERLNQQALVEHEKNKAYNYFQKQKRRRERRRK